MCKTMVKHPLHALFCGFIVSRLDQSSSPAHPMMISLNFPNNSQEIKNKTKDNHHFAMIDDKISRL